ncbi:MAG: 3-5 exoribonuclease [Solirubrobacterales bacterium]|jgi:3'-5' exoribonuclease|nr:3-5 exoribonuclease [Solirubrobacterales bacterium]
MEAAVAQIPRAHPEVAELRAGQRFEGRYACLSKERQTARNGSAYLSLRLRDRTGTIAARAFRDADRIGLRFEAGDALEVRGRVERFNGELVIELDDARPIAPGSFDPAEFLPAAYRSADELEGFLEHLAGEVHDPALRAVVEAIVFSGPLAADFRRAPCTRRSHHAYLGGLLEHTVAVSTLVLETCALHPRLDSDLLMAAAIVHDAGRAREFTYGAEFGLSEEGRMLGHLAIGAEIVGQASSSLPAERRLTLLNCVLSHHGPDAGPGRAQAARRGAGPGHGFASAEALALYRLNALDASVKGALEHG